MFKKKKIKFKITKQKKKRERGKSDYIITKLSRRNKNGINYGKKIDGDNGVQFYNDEGRKVFL